MPSNRFYTPYLHHPVILEGDECHHLSRVMRITKGETVELVDGKGNLAKAKVDQIEKGKAHLIVETTHYFPAPTPLIFLAVPLMRPSKLEWVIEKGTELGADLFLFYSADRAEKTGKIAQQLDRMRNITVAAMKQSGRLYLPTFEIVDSLEHVLQKDGIILFGDIDPKAPWIESAKQPTLFISGPEAGFSTEEIALLKQRAKGVQLSTNTLRAETAPIVALALLKAP